MRRKCKTVSSVAPASAMMDWHNIGKNCGNKCPDESGKVQNQKAPKWRAWVQMAQDNLKDNPAMLNASWNSFSCKTYNSTQHKSPGRPPKSMPLPFTSIHHKKTTSKMKQLHFTVSIRWNNCNWGNCPVPVASTLLPEDMKRGSLRPLPTYWDFDHIDIPWTHWPDKPAASKWNVLKIWQSQALTFCYLLL